MGRSSQQKRQRVGLALGAGGARGVAHVGVLKALTQADVPVDAIVGTSVGAMVGAIYAAGQLEDFERLLRKLEWSDVLRMFDPVWPRSGLISGSRIIDRLAGVLGDWRIQDLALPFAAVSVDLITGEEIVIREGKVIDAIRASISIPGVFVPHRQGGKLLVDGALRNPVPVSHLEDMDVDIRIAVNLHSQPVREISNTHPHASDARPTMTQRATDALDRRLARFRKRGPDIARSESDEPGGPNLFDVLTASMTVLEHELTRHRLAREPADVVIEPDVHGIRSFEFHKARQGINAGLHETEQHLPKIQHLLKRRRYWPRRSAG